MNFAVPAEYKVKIIENVETSIGPGQRIEKKGIEHESNCDTSCNRYTRHDFERLFKGLEELEIGGQAEDTQL